MPEDLPMFRAGPASLFPTAALGNRTDIRGPIAADSAVRGTPPIGSGRVPTRSRRMPGIGAGTRANNVRVSDEGG